VPWVLDVAPPFQLGDRCAICGDEKAITTTLSDHQNVVGFNDLGWRLDDLQLQIPCGSRCDRRLKILRWAFWALFLAPWMLLTVLSLSPPEPIMRWGVVPLLIVAGALNFVGYVAFVIRWWLRRSLRVIRVTNSAATLAFRDEQYARQVGDAHGTAPRKVLWTG
jgi:hypothetical protein